MKGGNFERECIEENCDTEELAEVFDNVEVSEPIQQKYDKCSKIVTAGIQIILSTLMQSYTLLRSYTLMRSYKVYSCIAEK